MAKTQPVSAANSVTVADLSPGLRKQVISLRPGITGIVKQFAGFRQKIADIGPRIVKLFSQISAEHEGFTFIEFCRMFDPNVPTKAADYRKHATYYTLQYIRRTVQQQNTAGQRRGTQGVRDSSTDGLARSLATLLLLIDADSADKLWNAVQTEFQFGERVMTRLRKRVENTQPLVKVAVAKRAKIANVIHMKPAAPAAEAAAEPMAQPGQRIRRTA
jgi:hypothetical protein